MVILTSWRSNLAFSWIRHCWSAFRCHDFMTLGFPIYSVMLDSKISDFQKTEGNSRSFNCMKNNTDITILPQCYQCERTSDNKAPPHAILPQFRRPHQSRNPQMPLHTYDCQYDCPSHRLFRIILMRTAPEFIEDFKTFIGMFH